MTHKNRKLLWFIGAALVVLYFAPSAIQSFREAAAYPQPMEAMTARTQNARGVTPNNAAPAYAPLLPAARVSNLAGIWQGQQAQGNRALCQLALEIRDGAPGVLAGYTKLSCFPLVLPGQQPPGPVANILRSQSPASAVLAGEIHDGAVAFRITKTIGTTVEGCSITAFSVTPFGNDQIAAEWELGACGKGQIVAGRLRR